MVHDFKLLNITFYLMCLIKKKYVKSKGRLVEHDATAITCLWAWFPGSASMYVYFMKYIYEWMYTNVYCMNATSLFK